MNLSEKDTQFELPISIGISTSISSLSLSLCPLKVLYRLWLIHLMRMAWLYRCAMPMNLAIITGENI